MTTVLDIPVEPTSGQDRLEPPETTQPPRPGWAFPVVVISGVAVVAAFIVGVRGLMANPVVGTDAQGVTTLRGSFEPFPCPPGTRSCVQGYVQAGGRSVFVLLPANCSAPPNDGTITVRATPDRALGKGGYVARGCAQTSG